MNYTEIASISLAIIIAVVFIFFLTRRNTVKQPKKTHISVVNALSAFFNGDDNTAIEKQNVTSPFLYFMPENNLVNISCWDFVLKFNMFGCFHHR